MRPNPTRHALLIALAARCPRRARPVPPRPAEGIVLPESGRATDEMPSDYSFGCPPEVFRGTVD